MSINQHQFEQLSEMGISLWQHRTSDTPKDNAQTQSKHYLDIDLKYLASQQLFNDILLAIGLSIGEINHQSDHVDLGLFNWYFTATSSHNEIKWVEQQLFTPSITELSKSPVLKKQLWQLLTKQTQ
ncbi:DNA polymerase III subunit psi [Colwellia demingiae]|uniref:DNA polymerase III subunit psi n=1 Tax=Colwellia demingiae TaxID=89401 RepID=A0A5C6QMK0_9GAMM|nr:DNA polymerase III subunit psi [Colwellia demingiae]TWX69840.1 DNA polymerase III subunit psi [Colwellia demingiae]